MFSTFAQGYCKEINRSFDQFMVKSCTYEALPGVLGIQGEGLRVNYFQGFGEKAIGLLFGVLWSREQGAERSFFFQGAKTYIVSFCNVFIIPKIWKLNTTIIG